MPKVIKQPIYSSISKRWPKARDTLHKRLSQLAGDISAVWQYEVKRFTDDNGKKIKFYHRDVLNEVARIYKRGSNGQHSRTAKPKSYSRR